MVEEEVRGTVLIIGGGVAGLTAARALAGLGAKVKLVERSSRLGGRVLESVSVFPAMARGTEVVESMAEGLAKHHNVEVFLDASPSFARKEGKGFEVELQLGAREADRGCVQRRAVHVDAIIIATGLEPVDASLIPELGYPRLRNVILSTAFDQLLSQGKLTRPSDGDRVGAVAFVQCVGSRVEKRGVPYCSAVCCMNAIKNAIAVKDMDHSVQAYVLYIDIRTHGKGYEALYKRARERGVRFIRGQPSMVVKKPGTERLLVVGENTLLKELYEIPVDLVVLSVGLRQRQENLELFQMLGVATDEDGLLGGKVEMRSAVTSVPGVFVAGCVEAPKDVRESIAQGEAAAVLASAYLSRGP